MRKSIAFLVTVTAFMATPALATNMIGPRAEARVGWDRTTIDVAYDDGVDSISGDGHKSGLNLGAEIGYDAPLSPTLIAGAYAGVEFATTKKCSEVFGNDAACLKLGRNFTVGGRLGAKVSPLTMLYIKGGYSNGQLKASYRNDDDATLNFSTHTNRGGFHVGIGGEYALSSQTYVRAEYVRTNYNDYDYSDADIDASIDAHRDQLLLGFGLQF
jgi:outer membrane immunogenic protein